MIKKVIETFEQENFDEISTMDDYIEDSLEEIATLDKKIIKLENILLAIKLHQLQKGIAKEKRLSLKDFYKALQIDEFKRSIASENNILETISLDQEHSKLYQVYENARNIALSQYYNLLDQNEDDMNELYYSLERTRGQEKKEVYNKIKEFKLSDLVNILSYLVSVMEKEEYYPLLIPIQIKETNHNVINYNILILTTKEKEKQARREILDVFERPYDIENNSLEKETISNNYLRITFIKEADTPNVSLESRNISRFIGNYPTTPIIKIDNPNFSYLNDYLEKVMLSRLRYEKSSNDSYTSRAFNLKDDLEITYEELYALANEFLEKYLTSEGKIR